MKFLAAWETLSCFMNQTIARPQSFLHELYCKQEHNLEHNTNQFPTLQLFHKTSTDVIPIRDLKPTLDIDLQAYVNNPSLATPFVSSSIFVALTGFKRTPCLSLGL